MAFTLTLEDVIAMVADGHCEYCGEIARHGTGKMSQCSPSLDRLLPSDGYTRENVVLACMWCNSRKQNHTPESLRELADKIERAIARKRLALAG